MLPGEFPPMSTVACSSGTICSNGRSKEHECSTIINHIHQAKDRKDLTEAAERAGQTDSN